MDNNKNSVQDKDAMHLDDACRSALDMLEGIQRGDRILVAMDPDTYYWAEWEGDIEFIDTTKLLDDVQDACLLLDKCIEAKRFDLALKLGKVLLKLDVHTDDESGNYDPMSFNDLYVVGDIPVSNVVLNMMQAEYFAGERPQESILRLILYREGYPKLSLKDLLAALGETPVNFQQFLQDWLEMVSQREGPRSISLTEEAIQLLSDFDMQLHFARTSVEKNPQLYLLLAKSGSLPIEQRYRAAMDGVHLIPENYKIRSQVALEAAALASEKVLPRSDIESLWREAFCSDTSPINYLRLLLHTEQPEVTRVWMDTVLERPLPAPKYGRKHLALNSRSSFEIFIFRLLRGDFQTMFQEDAWGYEFIPGQARILFTVLCPGEPQSKYMRSAEDSMMHQLSFDARTYRLGLPTQTLEQDGESDLDVFRQCLGQWKNTISMPDREESLRYLNQLENYIDRDAFSVLQPCNRKEYTRVAVLVAMLGEAREVLGEPNGLQKTLHRYSEAWPMHRAFQRELRACGMQ